MNAKQSTEVCSDMDKEFPSTSSPTARHNLGISVQSTNNQIRNFHSLSKNSNCNLVRNTDANKEYSRGVTKLLNDRISSSFERAVMRELRNQFWYWGSISARDANRLLRDRLVGTFLVRDSHSDSCIFSVSYVTVQGIFHSRLARFNGKFCLGGPNALICSPSLVDFVKQAIQSSSDQNQSLRILMHNSSMEPAAEQIELRYPLCRSEFLASLKYYCRLTIRNVLAESGKTVDSLPLPKILKKFVESTTYLLIC